MESLPQYTSLSDQKKDNGQSRCITKSVVAALVLGLAAIVACASVAVVLVPLSKSEPDTMDLDSQERLHSMILENHIHAVSRRRVPANRASCYSEITNDSTPIARVEGRGIKWGTVAPPRSSRQARRGMGYMTKWNCNNLAFTKGGFNFSQEDQRLYFPTCGYYYISSQIFFQYSQSDNNNPDPSLSFSHGLVIRSNCDRYNFPRYLYSHSSAAQRQYMKTSTYVSDVAKMCEGGSIEVIIPTRDNLCCAYGDSAKTHFSAFLVQDEDCSSLTE